MQSSKQVNNIAPNYSPEVETEKPFTRKRKENDLDGKVLCVFWWDHHCRVAHRQNRLVRKSAHAHIAILARVFAYLPSFYFQILDLIDWTVFVFYFDLFTENQQLLTTWTMLWTETETSLKIPSLRYSKEMFSLFCLILVFTVNSSQSSLKFYGCINSKITHRINSLFPYKDRLNRSLKSKVVYKASCWDCDDFYIGKTKR